MVFPTPAAPAATNSGEWSAVTPENDGKRVGGQWAVVDAAALVTSTDEGYDDNLQPRNRSRRASAEQTADIAAHLDPARLGDSPTTDDGAPIIDGRGMVISGNGRTLAIRQAYAAENAELAQAYRGEVLRQADAMGIEVPEGIRQPVLVRRVDDLGDMSLEDFAARSNKSKVARMSNAEMAVNDGRRILDAHLLEIFFPSDSGDVLAASNRDFISGFLNITGGREEYIDAQGNLKSNLAPRVRAAVLAAMLNPEKREIIEQLLDNPQGWSGLINGLMGSSAQLAKLSGNADYDLSAQLSEAVEAYVGIARSGETVESFLAQQDFTRPPLSPEAIFLADLFEKNSRTSSGISGVLNGYYALARNIDTTTQDMFGGDNPTKIDLLRDAYRKHATAEAGAGVRWKIDGAMDVAYMAAVERGDMETAQRLVDEAAAQRGYTNRDERTMGHRAPNREDYNLATIRESDLVPSDYWTRPRNYMGTDLELQAHKVVAAALAKNDPDAKITIYRAIPATVEEGSARNGDWVTPIRAYAENEGRLISGAARIIEQTVPIKDLWWDGNSIAELGYDDGQGYLYRNTVNSRKLHDPVTYDDAGNVIPLSQRFNQRSPDIRWKIESEEKIASILDELERAPKGSNIVREYAPVDSRTAQKISAITSGDVDASNGVHVLVQSFGDHLEKQGHFKGEKFPDSLPLTREDLLKVEDIVRNWDDVEARKHKRGVYSIKYKKIFPDGTVFFVEEVWNGQKNRDKPLLASKTMFKREATIAEAKPYTPEATSQHLPSQDGGGSQDPNIRWKIDEDWVTYYRAGDASEVGIRPWTSFSPEIETAQAYQLNPGFGGETLRTVVVAAPKNVLEAYTHSGRGMAEFAEAIGMSAEDGWGWWDAQWRYPWEESSEVRDAINRSGYDAVQYTDDFPEGATTIVFTDNYGQSDIRWKIDEDRTNNPVTWASIVLAKDVLDGKPITAAKLDRLLPMPKFDGSKRTYAVDRAKRIAEKTRATKQGYKEDLNRSVIAAESDVFWQDEFVESAFKSFSKGGEDYGFAKARILSALP